MRLNWRQGILYATTMGMEGCWLYALLILLNKQAADGRLSIFGLLLFYPLAFSSNKLLQWLGWRKVYCNTVNGLAWVIGMLLLVKTQLFSSLGLSDPTWLMALPQAIANVIYAFEPELLILLGSATLWWLGRRLAYTRVSFTTSVFEFQFGLAILLIIFFAASQLKVQLADSIPIALAFFLFALLGMSIAHAQEGTSWLTGRHQGHLSGLLLVSISLIIILGLLISLVVTPNLLQLILVTLKWVWGLTTMALDFLVSLLPESKLAELLEPLPDIPMPPNEPTEEFIPWSIPEPLRSWLSFGYGIFFIGLILFALGRVSSDIFGWLRRKLTTTAGAEVESLPGAFRADILNLLKRIVFSLLRLRLPLWRQSNPEPPEITSIRQVYRQLLHWAATQGWPRPASQTPYEYLYTLEAVSPVSRDALHFITQHYVSARYGLSSPSDEELHQLRKSWHQVKQNRPKRPNSEGHNPT